MTKTLIVVVETGIEQKGQWFDFTCLQDHIAVSPPMRLLQISNILKYHK